MDSAVIIVKLPELDDKAIAGVQDFLHELLLAFESHYYQQLKCMQQPASNNNENIIIEGENPF